VHYAHASKSRGARGVEVHFLVFECVCFVLRVNLRGLWVVALINITPSNKRFYVKPKLYVCVCTYIHTYIYVYKHVYVHTHTFVNTYVTVVLSKHLCAVVSSHI